MPIGIGLNFASALGGPTPPNAVEEGVKGTIEQVIHPLLHLDLRSGESI
jgi:hypothetical protein